MIADRNVSNTKQNRMYIITKRTAIFCSPLFCLTVWHWGCYPGTVSYLSA